MEKLKEDGTLLHPLHIFYPELARTKVSKPSACVFNIGVEICPGITHTGTNIELETKNPCFLLMSEGVLVLAGSVLGSFTRASFYVLKVHVPGVCVCVS